MSDPEKLLEKFPDPALYHDRASEVCTEKLIGRDVEPEITIERVVDEREIDLVIMGTHGARGLRRVQIGNTTEEVIRRGRDRTTSSGVVRSGARIELYNSAGNYVTFTTTDASGNYTFSGLAAGNYTVRVINATVTSARTGYVAGVLPVQTYRTNASTGSAVAVTDYVGGQNPSVADAGNGVAGAAMNTATGVFTAGISGTAQSITNVTIGASSITGMDFGFTFEHIVNVNDSGQGSLRQFITNAITRSAATLRWPSRGWLPPKRTPSS